MSKSVGMNIYLSTVLICLLPFSADAFIGGRLSKSKIDPTTKIKMLFKMDGTSGAGSFVEELGNSVTHGSPSPTHSTSVVKFGPTSGYFNGGNLNMADNNDWWLKSDDFTFEAWIYPTSVATPYQTIASHGLASTADLNTAFIFRMETSIIRAFLKTSSNVIFGECISTSGAIAANQWQHIAYVRYGSVFKIYVNGTSVCSVTQSGTQGNPAGRFFIAMKGDLTSPFTGYMDDIRMTVGHAFYKADFTPPTSGF